MAGYSLLVRLIRDQRTGSNKFISKQNSFEFAGKARELMKERLRSMIDLLDRTAVESAWDNATQEDQEIARFLAELLGSDPQTVLAEHVNDVEAFEAEVPEDYLDNAGGC